MKGRDDIPRPCYNCITASDSSIGIETILLKPIPISINSHADTFIPIQVNYLEWQPKIKPTGKSKLGDPTRTKFSEPGHHFFGNLITRAMTRATTSPSVQFQFGQCNYQVVYSTAIFQSMDKMTLP